MAIGGLGRALVAMGHDVRVRAPAHRTGRTASRLRFNLALARRPPRDHDLVVGFDLDGCFLSTMPGAIRVTSLKGVMADEARFERGATRLRFRLLSRLERRNARAADRVVVTSRYSRGAAVAAYGLEESLVEVVPEGIALEEWPDPDRGGRRALGPGAVGGRPAILTVARQYRRKDTATLLRAMVRVHEQIPDAELRVVGAGPELEALRRRASGLGLTGSVRFLGEMSERAAVRAEYMAADVFALPSLQEGFGIAFLEAMASRLPVVAAEAGAAPEVVPAGEAGILIPPGDDRALAAALVGLLRDPVRRAALGAAGRRRAERFDWPLVAERFLEAVGLSGAVPGPSRPGAAGDPPVDGP